MKTGKKKKSIYMMRWRWTWIFYEEVDSLCICASLLKHSRGIPLSIIHLDEAMNLW